MVAEAFGARYDIHTGAALLFATIATALAIIAILIIRAMTRAPDAVRSMADEGNRARGFNALIRGFEALAVGDGQAALQQAAIAERKLRDTGLTRLLRAQASLLSGDDKAAQETFSAMLAAPESEFLGLRGLYLQAERAGEREAAYAYAERAFALHPDAQWAFDSVFAGGLERGAWGQMRETLETARKHKAIDSEKARRGQAALLAADAAAAASSGDERLALRDAEKALKLAPGLTPVAILAARLQGDSRKSRALTILGASFAKTPHADIVDAMNALLAGEPPGKRAKSLERLAAEAPQSHEAAIANAMARLALKDYRGAGAIFAPVLRVRASARLCTMMAEATIIAGGPGHEAIARDWLKKAAAAPRETDFSRGGVQLSRGMWGRIVREFMDAERLAPLSLEAGEDRGLTEEELKQLSFAAGPSSAQGGIDPNRSEEAELAHSERGEAAEAKLVGDRIIAARAVAAAGEVS
ncbi:MAG: heme biosynthesis HemY N-terminal domain-containing protein [Parvularculaceae bacterium]